MPRKKKIDNPFKEQKTFEYILIDWSNLVYSSYVKFVKNLKMIEGGKNLIYFNLIRKLNKMITEARKYLPNGRVVIVLDRKPTIRKNLYKEYKGNRTEHKKRMEEEFKFSNKLLWETASEFMTILPLPFIYAEGYEADDVIYTFVLENYKSSNILVYTRDEDLFQIIPRAYIISHKDYKIVKEEDVYEKYGVYPHDLFFYKSIFGDAGDNVPSIFKRKNMRSPNKKKIIEIIKNAYSFSDINRELKNLTGEDFSKELQENYNLIKLYIVPKDKRNTINNKISKEEFIEIYNILKEKYELNKVPDAETFYSNLKLQKKKEDVKNEQEKGDKLRK